jgi:pimeloyl-ACP methyl ester carboxylesterase
VSEQLSLKFEIQELLGGIPAVEEEPTLDKTLRFVNWHGSWMRGRHWDPLNYELNSLGYPTYAPDLPLDKPGMDARRLGRYGGDMLRELGDDDIALVLHSRSGNGGLWAAKYYPVSMLYFVCASLESPTIRFMRRRGDSRLPKRNPNPAFKNAIIENPDDPTMSTIKEEAAGELLFNRVSDPYERRVAVEDLRMTRRVENEPRLRKFPEYTPYVYYYAEFDNVIGRDWTLRLCKERLRTKPRMIRGADHCPMMSQPKLLADMLIEDSAMRRVPV